MRKKVFIVLKVVKSFAHKLFQGSVEFLLAFPIILALGIKYVYIHDLYVWLLMFFIMYSVGLFVGSIYRNHPQWLYVSIILILSGSSTYFFIDESIIGIAITQTLFFLAMYRGLLNTQKEWSDIFSIPYLWGLGFPIYFLSYFFFTYQNLYNQYIDLLTVVTIVFIIFTFFISNSETLKQATLSKQKKPYINQGIMRKNRFFILVTFIIILIISSFGVFQLLLGYLGSFIYFVYRFLRSIRLFEDYGEEEPSGGPFNDGGLPELEISDPSKIALFLDQVATYLAFAFYTFAIIMFVFVCFKRIRGIKFKQIFRSILDFLSGISLFRFDHDEDDLYTEEKESVFNFSEWKDNNKQRFKDYIQRITKREAQWSKLSSKEKARYVYRSLVQLRIKTGYHFHPSKTPSEVITDLSKVVNDNKLYDQLNNTYTKARYSDSRVNEDELENLQELLKKENA